MSKQCLIRSRVGAEVLPLITVVGARCALAAASLVTTGVACAWFASSRFSISKQLLCFSFGFCSSLASPSWARNIAGSTSLVTLSTSARNIPRSVSLIALGSPTTWVFGTYLAALATHTDRILSPVLVTVSRPAGWSDLATATRV